MKYLFTKSTDLGQAVKASSEMKNHPAVPHLCFEINLPGMPVTGERGGRE